MHSRNPERIQQLLMEYGISPLATAAFFVLVAFLWTLVLQHLIAYPFVFLFFGAAVGSGWFGGTIAGIWSVLLSAVLIAFFFVPPFFSFHIAQASRSYYIAFVASAIVVSWVSSSRKRIETVVREARDLLELRVHERTAEIEQAHLDYIESERRLHVLTEAIPQQIWSANAAGQVEYGNQHLLDFVGRSAAEIQAERFVSILHEEDREAFEEAWAEAIASGRTLEGEWRILGTDGEYRWFLIRSIPQRSESGEVACWYGTHIDIEERRRAEQALLEAQLELSRITRTLSMGELTAFIAHELNQPLTAVVANAYACRRWLGTDPLNLDRAVFTADQIIQEGTRAGEIMARIRALFRQGEQVREDVDINHEVHILVGRIRDEAIRRGVLIRTRLAHDLPRVAADVVQIQQVLFNLSLNGMDAMEGDHGHARELWIKTGCDGDGDVLVTVQDWGPGLSPEAAEKIFQPFFTTKKSGVGLGLTISRTIVEAHNGRIWAMAQPAGGTAVQFTIPVSL